MTMTSRHLRAIALHHLGRLAEAEAENRSVLATRTRELGAEHVRTLLSRGNLAAFFMMQAGERKRRTKPAPSWKSAPGSLAPITRTP